MTVITVSVENRPNIYLFKFHCLEDLPKVAISLKLIKKVTSEAVVHVAEIMNRKFVLFPINNEITYAFLR